MISRVAIWVVGSLTYLPSPRDPPSRAYEAALILRSLVLELQQQQQQQQHIRTSEALTFKCGCPKDLGFYLNPKPHTLNPKTLNP